jgi:alkyl hydroperoxide reductase subunit AhpC
LATTFPSFNLKAASRSRRARSSPDVTDKSYEGKWLVLFAWPMDFTFICPTEIAEFGKRNGLQATATRRCSG